MTRAAVPGLPSRHPIGEQLPALYADDDFAQRFTSGLDVVLAPVFATLDNLAAYLDPRVAPDDFVEWLAGWVGAEETPLAVRREAVARAVELHGRRGTRRGLTEALTLALGVHADVVGDGGTAWSRSPGADLPPTSPDGPVVRVWPSDAVDPARVHAIVRTMCPVHTTCRVAFLPAPPTDERS